MLIVFSKFLLIHVFFLFWCMLSFCFSVFLGSGRAWFCCCAFFRLQTRFCFFFSYCSSHSCFLFVLMHVKFLFFCVFGLCFDPLLPYVLWDSGQLIGVKALFVQWSMLRALLFCMPTFFHIRLEWSLKIESNTDNHSEEDVYAMLKECSTDPNKTTQKLLLQGRDFDLESY